MPAPTRFRASAFDGHVAAALGRGDALVLLTTTTAAELDRASAVVADIFAQCE